ncbi:hypothetical protein QG37_04591 [Candidozyma auris]|nr:hypothetical protein QG37_04591 [[Candida] auris]
MRESSKFYRWREWVFHKPVGTKPKKINNLMSSVNTITDWHTLAVHRGHFRTQGLRAPIELKISQIILKAIRCVKQSLKD